MIWSDCFHDDSALIAWVLTVVHDRCYVLGFANRIWTIRDGELGSYVDLKDQRRRFEHGQLPGGSDLARAMEP